MKTLKTPVVLFVFNRPEPTKKVFESIRSARPEKLFIVADGPRENKKDDIELCLEVLSIVEKVDWPCEVEKNYSKQNLGCGRRISTGIKWVFEKSDQIIILEDDCLPNEDFFIFMEEMLERYKDNKNIGSITGFSPQIKELDQYEYSYYFSKFFHMWGWGTWRRSWEDYEYDIKSWFKKDRLKWLNNQVKDLKISKHLKRNFNNVINTWDYQFMYCHLKNEMYCIKPGVNLIENLGVGKKDATHTKADNLIGLVKRQNLKLPLKHPTEIEWNEEIDKKVFKKYILISDTIFYIKNFIKKIPILNKLIYRLLKKR